MRPQFPLIFLLLLPVAGCSTLGYYGQSVVGHVALMSSARPIDTLLDEPGTDPELRRVLLHVAEIRVFANEALALPDNGSYRSYVPWAGEAVVWSLVATDEFSLEPTLWCYPVIGCAGYRGYFSRDAARSAANLLQGEGKDVAVNPVPAYSTLGWFSDPLPGTVTGWPLYRIAELIFHELAHQRLYVRGDSPFNEGFATAVARAGVERWLEAGGRASDLEEWRRHEARKAGFRELVGGAAGRLKRLYAAGLADAEARAGKAAEFAALREGYGVLKAQWGGYAGYDRWFGQPLNNAHIASVAIYESLAPAFERLLDRSGGDMALFFAACERLSAMPPSQRRAELARMLHQSDLTLFATD